MSGYKVVPVDPTAEMVEAYQKASSWTAPLSTWGYKAMLSASPAVQEEPVAWQPIGTCPRHVDVLFYREDAGVFPGKFTDADSFMTDKERDEWVGTEEEMFDLDAWSYEPEGVYRMDGDLVPTHWMPLPAPPATQGDQP